MSLLFVGRFSQSPPIQKLFCFLLLWLLVIPLAVSAAAFRFAWLSDTHVGSLTGEEDLRASVRDLNSLTGLSFVIISGDITEYGSLEQLRLAKQILDGLKIPCHVVPGNHDTKWSESGATDFPRLWKVDRFVFEHEGFRFIGMHEGPIMKMADGFWSPQDVRWLEDTLKQMPDKEQPVVFVTHYPLDDGIANWYVVLDLLKKYNIQAALCGHIHRNRKEDFEGVPGIMGRSNLRSTAEAGGYNIVEIKEDGTMSFAERAPGLETKKPWAAITLTRHDFHSGANHYPRPSFSINDRYPAVKERWDFRTRFTIASSPAVAGRLAIVGDASGTVYAVDCESGKLEWKGKTGNAVYSTPEIAGALAIVPSTDGEVHAFKVASGTEAWRYHTERPLVSSPRVFGSTVYFGASDGKFRALEAASGKLIWEFDRVTGFVETRPLIIGGKVIFGAWDEKLYALDSGTGKLVWQWHGDKPGVLYSPAACWPVAANGKVFVAAPDRYLSAIDLKDGTTAWRSGDYMVRESIGLSQDGSRVYARSMQDNIYAFSTKAREPGLLWKSDVRFGYDINSGMLMEKDGAVFYGTKNGVIFSLDAKTGSINWQHKIGVGVVNTVVPLSKTRVLATDFDGRIVLLEAEGTRDK